MSLTFSAAMTSADLLATRSSTSSRLLHGPGPTPEQLRTLLTLAMRVPDHGKLAPWRFIVITDQKRHELAEHLVRIRRQNEPTVAAEALDKDAQRFLHAPVIVTVVACITAPHKIPAPEQHASAAALCMQLLNAAHAHGFAAQWLTGWAAYDQTVAATLGLNSSEHVSGFIHLGHSATAAPERPRPALADKLSYF
jgi:nitroreductase